MADDSGDDGSVSLEEKLLQKHRLERKQLQAEVQTLKHSVSKGDKKRKKDATVRAAQMEAELDARHQEELQQLQSQAQVDGVTEAVSDLNIENNANAASAKPKISKAQKKREKKAQKEQERDAEIRKQDVENLMGSRHVETQKIKALLAEKELAIFEIPSDGNCLYSAIVHQLQGRSVESSMDGLRKQTADHMRENPDNFMPFLCQQDSGDPYTPAEFETYCHKLETTPEWGGQLELQALSNVLRVPIEVLQADTPTICVGEEHDDKPILLTYHHHYYGLGEHYNSVIHKSQLPDDEDEGFS